LKIGDNESFEFTMNPCMIPTAFSPHYFKSNTTHHTNDRNCCHSTLKMVLPHPSKYSNHKVPSIRGPSLGGFYRKYFINNKLRNLFMQEGNKIGQAHFLISDYAHPFITKTSSKTPFRRP